MSGSPTSRRTAIVWLVTFLVALPVLGFGLKTSGASDRLKGAAAVRAALADAQIRGVVKADHYTRVMVLPLDEHNTRVTFFAGQKVVLETAVKPNGEILATQFIDKGYIRAGAHTIQSPVALIVMTLLFLLMFATLPLRSLRNLDLLVLASTSLTIWVLNQRLFELSIWLAIPALAYLSLRCLRVGFAERRPAATPAKPLFHELVRVAGSNARPVLQWAVGVAALATVIVCIPGGATGDVGIASVSGATQLLHGNLPYGHVISGVIHGDTYPIFAYVMYIPAAIFLPMRDVFDNPDGALWVSTISMLVAASAMFIAGRNEAGRDFGLRNAFALLVFPPMIVTASSGSNDLTTAMFVALAVASIAHAGRSSFALSLAAWAKVVPVLALPLWIARYRTEGLRRAFVGPALITVAMLSLLLAYGGTHAVRVMLHGIAFQAGRGSVLSPWTVIDVPALHLIVQAAAVAAAAAAAYAVWRTPAIAADIRRVCALAAGIMLAVQLAANYWSYAYLPWVYPLLAAALLWPAGATRLRGSDGEIVQSTLLTDSGA